MKKSVAFTACSADNVSEYLQTFINEFKININQWRVRQFLETNVLVGLQKRKQKHKQKGDNMQYAICDMWYAYPLSTTPMKRFVKTKPITKIKEMTKGYIIGSPQPFRGMQPSWLEKPQYEAL